MLKYITTDLEIASRGPLDLLHAELDNWLVGRYAGKSPTRGQRLYKYGAYGQPRTPDAALRAFVDALGALPPTARRQWRTALRRDFIIRIQSGGRPVSLELALAPATLAAVAALGARIIVRVATREPAAKRRTKR